MSTTPVARELRFDDINVGDSASVEHRVSEKDVAAFAEVSGDRSPLHVDETYASATPLGKRVVHGMLLGAFVSQLIGMQLPGRRALILTTTLEFKKPVHIEDLIRVEGTVVRTSAATRIIEVAITILVHNVTMVQGSAHVLVRE